jgi:predicted nucleic acid-binding protein
MIYLDPGSLLKLVWNEPDSSAVVDAIGAEDAVVISMLAEVETLVHLKAAYLGGEYNAPQWRRLEARFSVLRHQSPYYFRDLPGSVFQTALRQHRNSGAMHCRALDRLHLAAMEELGILRLMTNDEGQAKAAAAAGFEVIRPVRIKPKNES